MESGLQRLVAELFVEFSRKVINLSCRVVDNRLQLSGQTDSFYSKQLLQERAKKLVGLPVENLVEVVLHSEEHDYNYGHATTKDIVSAST
jgi:hypothetical protein